MQSYGKRKNQHSSSSKARTGLPISIMDIRATPNTSHSYIAKTRSRWKRFICGPQNPHNNGQFADKAHAPFSYFITSNPVPETKGRNITKTSPPEILPTKHYRKDLDKWRLLPKRSKKSNNHFHRNESQNDRHDNGTTLPTFEQISYWSTKVSPTCPTSCQIFQD